MFQRMITAHSSFLPSPVNYRHPLVWSMAHREVTLVLIHTWARL